MKAWLLVLCLFFSFAVSAQYDSLQILRDTAKGKELPENLKKLIEEITSKKEKVTKDAEIEIDGLIFDETKTKSGKDFYDYFFSGWSAPVNVHDYSIYVLEKPYRLTTTLIEIRINDATVFQAFLQPRGDIVEELAKQAIAQTRMYLANYEQIMQQLSGKDQSGSGIY